jgi:hypothetical protein
LTTARALKYLRHIAISHMRRRILVRLFLVCLAFLLLQRDLYAYLDPGSGSMLMQLLLGGVAGLGVIVRLYWRRLTGVVGVREQVAQGEKDQR